MGGTQDRSGSIYTGTFTTQTANRAGVIVSPAASTPSTGNPHRGAMLTGII